MQVMMSSWRGKREVDLESALVPSSWNEGGVAERAQADATAACEALGRLSALLVEKGVLTLDEAVNAMGISETLERIS